MQGKSLHGALANLAASYKPISAESLRRPSVAQGRAEGESPSAIDECWAVVKSRVDLGACLSAKVQAAETALRTEDARTMAQMRSPEAVSSAGTSVATSFAASQAEF
jgi:hypothetical protein